MPAECSPQKSLIMLEILPAEFIQAYPTVSSKLGNILQQKQNTVIKTEYVKNTTCFNLVKIHDWFCPQIGSLHSEPLGMK